MERAEMSEQININVVVDDKIFRRFAVFDSFYRKRFWVRPVIFASIMTAFSLACFVMRGFAEQAELIGCVLLAIGLGLPAAHLLRFFRTVSAQITVMGLKIPRQVYSLRLSREPDGVLAASGGKLERYEWNGLFGAYRVAGCTYLYVNANKAYLLPDEQVEGGADALWTLLADMLPGEKLRRRR